MSGEPDSTETMARIDSLTDEIRTLVGTIRSVVPQNSATVTMGDSFKNGLLVGVCFATCIATWVALVLFAMEIHDLRAWKDVFNNDISRLRADISTLQHKESQK